LQVGYGLNLEQKQKLIMTPELRQAIMILQMPLLELGLYIEQQLQENPFLEISEEEADFVEAEKQDDIDNSSNEKREYDIDWETYFQDSSDIGLGRQDEERSSEPYNYENIAGSAPTLTEHLLFQLHLATNDKKVRAIGEYIIWNINEQGYLPVPLDEIAACLNIGEEEAEKTLKLIHTFDPPGVGARSLQECLLLQVKQLDIKNDLLAKIIMDHLEDLAKGRLGTISHQLGISMQEVQMVGDIIKTLEPKPGRRFSSNDNVRHVVADVVLEKAGSDYFVIVNDASLPRVFINSTYRAVLSQSGDLQTKSFIESKFNAAAWLVRSIEQRRLTLYKVASCLVELQREFLDHGIKYLKPLNLKKVAGMVDLHESTVSRAISNKYIQTPQGTFEMRIFLSPGLAGNDGKETSTGSIKKMLKELVSDENPKAPLSDQKIAEYFRQQGIKISRRTVAKYRDELGILPIRQRIRY